MVHKLGIAIIALFPAAKTNPEKVVWLFTLIEDLKRKPFRIVHFLDNLFSYSGFIRI
jgi:hypothetical protein